jgi:hypothetical protein
LSTWAAALVMIAPPYEWPTATTGPEICRIALATYALSEAMPRSGLDTAVTGTPDARSRATTSFQPELSAKAPCTRATVGVGVLSVMAFLLRRSTERDGVHPTPPCGTPQLEPDPARSRGSRPQLRTPLRPSQTQVDRVSVTIA